MSPGDGGTKFQNAVDAISDNGTIFVPADSYDVNLFGLSYNDKTVR